MYKVVYFDEDSAGDYLNISNKGIVKENTEKSTSKQRMTSLAINPKANLVPTGATITFIAGFLLNNAIIHFILGCVAGFLAALSIALNLSYTLNREDKELVSTHVDSTILSQFLERQKEEKQKEEEVVSTQVTNTILPQFLKRRKKQKQKEEKQKKQKQILCIKPIDVRIEANSFSYIKFYGSVLKIVNTNSEGIDISKIGDVAKETKGYYDLIATIEEEQSTEENYYILRLNAETFRNNYKLTDLLHMKLTYYGIKVGKMSLGEMDVQHMFNTQGKSIITAQQMLSGIQQGKSISELEEENKNIQYEIIDVILAGVGEYGEN